MCMCLTESGPIECKRIVSKLRQIDGVTIVIIYTIRGTDSHKRPVNIPSLAHIYTRHMYRFRCVPTKVLRRDSVTPQVMNVPSR